MPAITNAYRRPQVRQFPTPPKPRALCAPSQYRIPVAKNTVTLRVRLSFSTHTTHGVSLSFNPIGKKYLQSVKDKRLHVEQPKDRLGMPLLPWAFPDQASMTVC